MTKFIVHTHGLHYDVTTAYEISRTVSMNDLMIWCDARFQGFYSNTLMMGSGSTRWHFQNRKEAIWFALTWT